MDLFLGKLYYTLPRYKMFNCQPYALTYWTKPEQVW